MVKISNLPAVTSSNISLADLLAMVDLNNNITDNMTIQQLITFVFNNVPSGAIPGSIFDYVISGGVWSGDAYASTRNASMTAITVYINSRSIAITAVTARTFTASKDTYIDVLDNLDGTGTLVYTEVANNAASPALASNSLRIGIVVTGATFIAAAASINQGQHNRILPIASSVNYSVTDSLGNLICPRDPARRVIGYREYGSTQGSITTLVDLTGLTAVPVIVPSDRRIKLTYRGNLQSTVAGDVFQINLEEVGVGAVHLTFYVLSNANNQENIMGTVYLEPSAGLHTYKLSAQRSAGSGTGSNVSSTANPLFVMIELA